jgi:cytochrome c oxidase cbb3-type subunit 3/ubiquinol-cytochrome c reductase cytochrome c subunit
MLAHSVPLSSVSERSGSLLSLLAVVVSMAASGTIECEPNAETEAQMRGQRIYGTMCAVCHGADREGYKADQAPALGNQSFLASVSATYLATAIASGRGGTTMSAWSTERGGPLSKPDVAAVAEYLRSWQEVPSAFLDERPLKGDAARGEGAFEHHCQRCHGRRGTGGTYERIGAPELLGSASDGFLRYAIRYGRPGTEMPGFRAVIGDDAIDDVLAALRKWQQAAPPPRLTGGRPPPLPLGPVPLNADGPEPMDFKPTPAFTSADVIERELARGARMAILDARAPSDYTSNHVAGAVSVPFYDPTPYFDELPHDAWLVCYCGCPHAESGQLARKLVEKGFTKVTVLDQGLGYWSNKKYPTHQGVLP